MIRPEDYRIQALVRTGPPTERLSPLHQCRRVFCQIRDRVNLTLTNLDIDIKAMSAERANFQDILNRAFVFPASQQLIQDTCSPRLADLEHQLTAADFRREKLRHSLSAVEAGVKVVEQEAAGLEAVGELQGKITEAESRKRKCMEEIDAEIQGLKKRREELNA
jgi:hypothetical protein